MNAYRFNRLTSGGRAAVAAAALAVTSLGASAGDADPAVDREILVRLQSTAGLGSLLTKYGLTATGQFGARPIYRLQVIDLAAKVKDVIGRLAKEPAVLSAEPNFMHSSPEARKNNFWAIGTAGDYTAQWAPQAIRLNQVHATITGANVRVAVLDTGVDASHTALADRLLPGLDFVDGGVPAEAQGLAFGHGTHVAGLVALAAPGAKIVPLRVMDGDGRTNAWVLAEALLYAVDPDRNPATPDGAHVINLSLGSLSRTRLFDAISQLATCNFEDPGEAALDFTDPGYNDDKARCSSLGGGEGAVIVAAAGNSGNSGQREYPAAESAYGKLAVGASAAGRRLATFSNTGSWVDLAAPGEGITSSVPPNPQAPEGYATWSGTSMAAPLVAGVAARVRQAEPGLSTREVARRIARTTALLCGTPLRQLDAAAAVSGIVPPDQPCP